jgi:ubiquinone/menaquinone biosynthesis C-methylase UbiE
LEALIEKRSDRDDEHAVNKAFSKQSFHFDTEDQQNIILQKMRAQVYAHVQRFLKPASHVLELNAGTGIDALKFVSWGHQVKATDLSDGMIAQINKKINLHQLEKQLSARQLSYENLQALAGEKFDFVFSNFGGLNCIHDLSTVTRHLPLVMKHGAIATWVVMPRVCPWEIAGFMKGHGMKAFRRFKKGGVRSHLEGEYFTTHYHSLAEIKKAFGEGFTLLSVEGLAALSPPPHQYDFGKKFPLMWRLLNHLDRFARKHFPFNRWADHIIVTFQFNP